MAYTLPLDNLAWPDFRILVAPSFGAPGGADSSFIAGGDTNSGLPMAATSSAAWIQLPYKGRNTNKPGFYVVNFERACLPFVARATLAYSYGDMDDAATPSPATTALDVNWEVRIQASPRGLNQWATVYWGRVEFAEDKGSPGAILPRGTKYYHCVDGLYRAKRWLLDHHGTKTQSGYGAGQQDNVFGFPGFNYQRGADAPLLGNRDVSTSAFQTTAGSYVHFHQMAGSTKPTDTNFSKSLWTDQQALEVALAVSRPVGEPAFAVQGATYLLNATNPWVVQEGEDVHTFICKVLRRERGRGVAFVDWSESDPNGQLTVFIRVNPQLAADVNYTDPSTNGAVSIRGATSYGTATTVDLIGDHRLVEDQWAIGDPSQFRVDFLEVLGEPIEVALPACILDGKVGTGNQFDGVVLTRGWTNSQQSTFANGTASISAQAKEEDKFNLVYQGYRFNAAWNGLCGDGDGLNTIKGLYDADYRTNAAGQIITPTTAATNKSTDPYDLKRTSNLLIEVMPDIPLLEGYNYSGAKPERWDTTTETDMQPRRRMTGYVRVAPGRFLQFDDPGTGLSASMQVADHIIWIRHTGDEINGSRFFSVSTVTGYAYDYSAIMLTLGIRLPHRVRFAYGDPVRAVRRGRIFHPGSHLWLAAPGAVFGLDTTTTSSGGYAARRVACGSSANGSDSTPGILRDDRSGLAAIAALSWSWYGTGSTHRTARWAIRDCGFLPSYQAYSGTSIPSNGGSLTTVNYPTLGQCITQISANGATTDINTPLTRIAYNNEAGITNFATDWAELEYVQR